MVFSSLFFVFFFLALNLIAYHFADGIKRKNMVLLGFSLVFYSWGKANIFCFCSAWSSPPGCLPY